MTDNLIDRFLFIQYVHHFWLLLSVFSLKRNHDRSPAQFITTMRSMMKSGICTKVEFAQKAESTQKAESAQKAESVQNAESACFYMKSQRILYWKAEPAQKAESAQKAEFAQTVEFAQMMK